MSRSNVGAAFPRLHALVPVLALLAACGGGADEPHDVASGGASSVAAASGARAGTGGSNGSSDGHAGATVASGAAGERAVAAGGKPASSVMTSSNGGAGPAATAVALAGDALIDGVDVDGTLHFGVAMTLGDAADSPVTLTRSPILFAGPGGFAFEVTDPVSLTGNFLGWGPVLQPAVPPIDVPMSFVWSTPATHFLMRFDGTSSSGADAVGFLDLPIRRPGFAPPEPSVYAGDLALVVQGPLETVPLSTGVPWLTVVGQLANLSPDDAAAPGVSGELLDPGGESLGALDFAPATAQITHVLAPFLGARPAPEGATSVRLKTNVRLGAGPPRVVDVVVPIAASHPLGVASPVSGTWQWTNGQGETVYHTHFQFPEQRYAYDLVVTEGGATFAGDPSKNASYHCFGQPVRAALDGTVVEVVDDIPDNFGDGPNPANSPMRNSQVVLAHAGGAFTLYAHVAQGSALVKVGDGVKAGQALAAVGNAGFTTQPHLHFAAFEIDGTGRQHALPLAPTGLLHDGGAVVTGVPLGGVAYTAP